MNYYKRILYNNPSLLYDSIVDSSCAVNKEKPCDQKTIEIDTDKIIFCRIAVLAQSKQLIKFSSS